MAKAKNNGMRKQQQCYISVPSQVINSLSSSALQSLLLSPKKASKSSKLKLLVKNPRFWFFFLFLFGFLAMLYSFDPLVPFSSNPCSSPPQESEISNGVSSSQQIVGSMSQKGENLLGLEREGGEEEGEKSEFWKQPDGLGYRPSLDLSREYKEATVDIMKDRHKYLVVVVSGGMNQQRNQIVDAVVIARILGAALVVPILQVNVIWGDESEFSDIFDLDHFKCVLADEVRVVSSLPSTHLMSRPVEEKHTPLHVSPQWIRARYLRRMRREGVLLLRGLDSRLSKDLPSDLQKLRCKVAFHALKFAPQILELGNKLTERMQSKGPYLALHLRMEKDVWVRTGCLPGLSKKYDEIINNERKQRPELLTSRSNMTYHDRKLAGLCPLNALKVTQLLKALGAPKSARIYWAGGNPLGGEEALLPLSKNFLICTIRKTLPFLGSLSHFPKEPSLWLPILTT